VAICDVAAANLKNHDAAGRRAIMVGAVFFSVRGVSKTTSATLLTSLAAAPAGGAQPFIALPDTRKRAVEASAGNYVSRCRAAAMLEHFPWKIDPNTTLSEIVDSIFPEFCAKWPTVNSIKRSGPDMPAKRTPDAQGGATHRRRPSKRKRKPAVAWRTILPPCARCCPVSTWRSCWKCKRPSPAKSPAANRRH
jgi:hypothetical protein